MDATFWIAVIGCVTGVVSLGIELARFWRERPRVTVETCNELNNFVYIEDGVATVYLNVRVYNGGPRPVLLRGAYLLHADGGMAAPVKAMEDVDWRFCDNLPLQSLPAERKLPASLPAGGLWQGVFLYKDLPQHYTAEEPLWDLTCYVVTGERDIHPLTVQMHTGTPETGAALVTPQAVYSMTAMDWPPEAGEKEEEDIP